MIRVPTPLALTFRGRRKVRGVCYLGPCRRAMGSPVKTQGRRHRPHSTKKEAESQLGGWLPGAQGRRRRQSAGSWLSGCDAQGTGRPGPGPDATQGPGLCLHPRFDQELPGTPGPLHTSHPLGGKPTTIRDRK